MARRHASVRGSRLGVRLGVGFVLGLLLLANPAYAADPDVPDAQDGAVDDSWAYDVWHDTMSPYCPGRTLAECPSPQADELRLWILDQASGGASRDEVQEVLFQKFGDEILTAPRPEGWGLAAYAIPVLGFVLGGGIVVLVVRRLMAAGPEAPGPAAAIDPEIQRRIDEESGA